MKKIILILVLFIFVVGCTQQIVDTPKMSEEQTTVIPQEKIATASESALPEEKHIEEPEVPEPTKKLEVYNPETGETKITEKPETEVIDNTIASQGDELLKVACQNAIKDYPEWTTPSTDLIIWEDSDKEFNFRNSPEDLSSKISSPIPSSETLVDMDFVGLNEISYVITKDNQWQIGLFKLHWPDASDNSIIHKKTESMSDIEVSPLNKKEFIVFYVKENKAVLKYMDTANSKEEIVWETSAGNSVQKLAVSPKATSAYLLYDNILRIFDIFTKKITGEINSVSSVVWIGDSHLLYTNADGTFIYNIKNKDNNKLNRIGAVSALSFNPKEKGIIAYNSGSKSEIVDCQTWQELNSLKDGEIKTFTSERTAIIEKNGVLMYWRFKDNDWILTPSHIEITNYVTIWKRY